MSSHRIRTWTKRHSVIECPGIIWRMRKFVNSPRKGSETCRWEGVETHKLWVIDCNLMETMEILEKCIILPHSVKKNESNNLRIQIWKSIKTEESIEGNVSRPTMIYSKKAAAGVL
ncbi:hypothetical protein JTB14_036732 [Gonioctena quinquepunctata]|nr:hypothetical protein JTB14_036732 [Gonioctena quinquepunctata]